MRDEIARKIGALDTDFKGLEVELAARFEAAKQAAALEKEEARRTEVWDALFEEEE